MGAGTPSPAAAVGRARTPPRRARRTISNIVGVFVLLLVSLQLFLLMVGLEAVTTYDDGLAWTAAVTSMVLAACAAFLYGYLRRSHRR